MREFKRHFKIYYGVVLFMMIVFVFLKMGILHAYGVESLEMTTFSGSFVFRFYYILMLIGSSLFIGLILALTDTFIISKLIYRKSLFVFLILTSLINIAIIGGSIYLFYHLTVSVLEVVSLSAIIINLQEVKVFGFFLSLVILFARLVIEIDQKLGHGNLWKFLTGQFYNPREEERIFMFIDLKGATTIAEKLGHFSFSRLLRDCFNDLSIVDKYHAEVYQYVGDEVVLSWPVGRSKNYGEFLEAFFAFKNKLKSRESYYMRTYGLLPNFKAGVNSGPVVATEVGRIKREISYHGDTLNTAARIQDKCNDLDANLLVSEALYKVIKPYSPYNFDGVGSIKLKGKEKEVRLYKVKE